MARLLAANYEQRFFYVVAETPLAEYALQYILDASYGPDPEFVLSVRQFVKAAYCIVAEGRDRDFFYLGCGTADAHDILLVLRTALQAAGLAVVTR